MRRLTLGLLLVSLAVVGVILARRSRLPRESVVGAPASSTVDQDTVEHARPLPPTVPSSPASTAPRAVPRFTGPIPRTIDEADRRWPGLREARAKMSPDIRASLTAKLELVAAVRDCVAGRVKSHGGIDVRLEFKVGEHGRSLDANVARVFRSTLPSDEDEIARKCLQESFKQSEPLQPGDEDSIGPEWGMGTRITFPAEDDPIFSFCERIAAGDTAGLTLNTSEAQ